MCAKIEFQIQILHSCYPSNADSVYSVGKINPRKLQVVLVEPSQRRPETQQARILASLS